MDVRYRHGSKNDTGSWKMMLGKFESPEILDVRTIRFRKKPGSEKDWRDLQNVGFFYILPKHAFESQDFNSSSSWTPLFAERIRFLGSPSRSKLNLFALTAGGAEICRPA